VLLPAAVFGGRTVGLAASFCVQKQGKHPSGFQSAFGNTVSPRRLYSGSGGVYGEQMTLIRFSATVQAQKRRPKPSFLFM